VGNVDDHLTRDCILQFLCRDGISSFGCEPLGHCQTSVSPGATGRDSLRRFI
jgi:hypothetical protein